MPNRIYMPFLDTMINPNRISSKMYPTGTKENDKVSKPASKRHAKTPESIKDSSDAITAMVKGIMNVRNISSKNAPVFINALSPEIMAEYEQAINEIEDIEDRALEAKHDGSLAKVLASYAVHNINTTAAYNRAIRELEHAKERGYEDEINGSTEIKYSHFEPEYATPERTIIEQYKDGNLTNLITLIGDKMLTIHEFNQGKYTQFIYSDGLIYKLERGEFDGTTMQADEKFIFGNDEANLITYAKNVKKTESGGSTIGKVLCFDIQGQLTSYRENVEFDKNNIPSKTDLSVKFQNGKLKSAIIKENSQKHTADRILVNLGKESGYDYYVGYSNPYGFNSRDLEGLKYQDYSDIQEYYNFTITQDGSLRPNSHLKDCHSKNGIISFEEGQYSDSDE